MATTENLLNLKIHKVTQDTYDAAKEANTLDESALYLVPEKITDADVELSGKFTITQDFGYYKIPSGQNSTEIGAVGQSLHAFLQGAFAQEDKTVFSRTPYCNISISGGSYEIGSTVAPSASWSTNAGTYKWGTYSSGAANFAEKSTGITYKDSNGNSLESGDINLSNTRFVIGESAIIVTATGTAKRSAVTNYPCSNLGLDITSELLPEYKSEQSLSVSQTATFTSYRKGFYGALTSKTSAINSTLIRGLSESTSSTPTSGNSWELYIPIGTVRVIFAYPATLQDVSSVIDSATSYDIKPSFTKQTISVDGASAGYSTNYKVYVSDFAKATTEANTYTITI